MRTHTCAWISQSGGDKSVEDGGGGGRLPYVGCHGSLCEATFELSLKGDGHPASGGMCQADEEQVPRPELMGVVDCPGRAAGAGEAQLPIGCSGSPAGSQEAVTLRADVTASLQTGAVQEKGRADSES